jgi:lysophospholipase L1-like esterase
LTHRYDGVTRELWLDDVRLHISAGTAGGVSLQDLGVGFILNNANTTNLKMQALALYGRALTDAEIVDVYANFRQNSAVDVGLDYNVYVAEGDSITSPAISTGAYPLMYSNNATRRTFGAIRAFAGSTVATLVSRAALVDAVIPESLDGRKFILSVMIGRNDFAMDQATWLASLADYLDARRAAGWKVVLCTILPSTISGFNAWRNTLNDTLRTWVGIHCDALCDTAADATMGVDSAASDVALYGDGTHPTAAGQANLEAIIRPVLNGI